MKRVLALLATAIMILSLTACGETENNGSSASDSGSVNESAPQNSAPSDIPDENNSDKNNPDMNSVRTGAGVVISMEGSKSATETSGATAQAEITVCAASFDSQGKILDVMFDVAEPGVEFDNTGTLTTDLTAGFKTKRQLGDSYGMKEASDINKEWYQQVDSLEDWMIGKTAEEVFGMNTVIENGKEYPDEADLTSSATIAVGDFLKALQMAYNNAEEAAAGETEQNQTNSQSEAESSSEAIQ